MKNVLSNFLILFRLAVRARWPTGLEHWTGWSCVRIPLRQLIFASELWQFRLPRFASLSEETLEAVGPFYLVFMPREVTDPTSLHWKCVTCHGLHILA